MRPGHINVFDGLRITTEHMNYLQGSLHSAVEDIREILGLGTVFIGFDVVAEGNSITISPGLAFDYQKNRIASDEPKTVVVSFAPGENTKYVCIKYDQIEDGQVEGRFTLVWDTCAIELRPTPPQPNENVVAIAKIESVARNGSRVLEVTRLGTGKNGDAQNEEPETPPAEEAAPASETPPGVEAGAAEPTPDTARGEVIVAEPATDETTAANETTAEATTTAAATTEVSTAEPTETKNTTAENSPQALLVSAPGPNVNTKIRQGVIRLAPPERSWKLASETVIDSLIRRAKEPASDSEVLSIPLAEVEVALAFPVLSLSCQTIISGSLSRNADSGESETAPCTFSTTARGEVTPGSDGSSQFGISTTRVLWRSDSQGLPYSFDELTESGIANLPLRILGQVSKNGKPAGASDFLHRLELLIEVPKADAAGFKIVCSLRWRGAVNTEEIKEIENKGYVFEWGSLVAWKALGVSQ